MKVYLVTRQLLMYRVIFVIALFSLIFVAAMSVMKGNELDKSAETVIHSHKVGTKLELLITLLKDAESQVSVVFCYHKIAHI